MTTVAYADIAGLGGTDLGYTDWLEVTQDRVNLFADAVDDHQWIHVDPQRAASGPFGAPIAHGFLTLSLLTHLDASIPKDMSRYEGVVMGVNYGFDKVRFVNPVKVGQRIRATSVLTGVDLKDPNSLQVTRTLTVEVDGESKPAVVADWITRLVYG